MDISGRRWPEPRRAVIHVGVPDATERQLALLCGLAMFFELRPSQRCATAQRTHLRMAEHTTIIIRRTACAASHTHDCSVDLGEGLLYVGGCRSLARHAGPFPLKGSPTVRSSSPRCDPRRPVKTAHYSACQRANSRQAPRHDRGRRARTRRARSERGPMTNWWPVSAAKPRAPAVAPAARASSGVRVARRRTVQEDHVVGVLQRPERPLQTQLVSARSDGA